MNLISKVSEILSCTHRTLHAIFSEANYIIGLIPSVEPIDENLISCSSVTRINKLISCSQLLLYN